ncbi:MAG: hypothetical protein V4739_04100, partial [Pseudomonadota bacterium]
MVVDPWYCTLDFGGAEVHYLPTDGVAITQLSHRANAFTQLVGGVNNINLRTPPGGTAVALELKGTAPQTRTSTRSRGITAQGFDVGLRMSDYAYLTWINGFIADGCETGVLWLAGADAGENVNLVEGAISNGGLALDIRGQAACLNLSSGFSIDYNQKAVKISGSGARVMMDQCHIELPGATCLPGQIVVDGNGSLFLHRDGEFLLSDRFNGGNLAGPYGFSHMVEVLHPNCLVKMPDTRLHNHRNLADTWAIGPGRVWTDGVTYADALMPRRAHHSQAEMGVLTGYVFQEQAPNTLQVATAANRVTITRGQVGAAFVQSGCASMPIAHLRNRRLSLAPRLASDMGVAYRMSAHWSDTPARGPGTQLARFNIWTGHVT